MTMHQHTPLASAKDMWKRGFRIPTTLFASMAAAGLDVVALEIKHFKDSK